jgi:hypothetical protein
MRGRTALDIDPHWGGGVGLTGGGEDEEVLGVVWAVVVHGLVQDVAHLARGLVDRRRSQVRSRGPPRRSAARLKQQVRPNSRSTRSGVGAGRCSPWSGRGTPARPAQSSLSLLASGPPLGPANDEHWRTRDLGGRLARRRRLGEAGVPPNASKNTAPLDPVPDSFDRQLRRKGGRSFAGAVSGLGGAYRSRQRETVIRRVPLGAALRARPRRNETSIVVGGGRGAMSSIESVHRERVVGSLAMFDRMIFKGHPQACTRPAC